MKTTHPLLRTTSLIASFLMALTFLPPAGRAQCCNLDPAHNPGSGANGDVYASVRQNDGKLLIAGYFSSYNGVWRNNLARLTATGANDSTYSTYGVNGFISAIALDPNTQSAVVVGPFSQAGGYYTVTGSAKFVSNGAYDSTFSSPSLTPYPYCVAVQSDGKILIGGAFTYVNGNYRPSLARLNPNGSVDTSFNAGTIYGTVYAIKPMADGKILIGGLFTSVGGSPRTNLARLLSNGGLDNFPIGNHYPNSTVYAIEVAADSRILLGGEFTQVHGQSCPYLARLESDGVMALVPSTPPNAMVRSIKAVPNSPENDFAIAGDFTLVGGYASQGLALFDGATLAAECIVGAGFTPTSVRTLTLVPEAVPKAFCGGTFTAFMTTPRNRVAQVCLGLCN
jgi:uncharacterized delta-60 repeat protein